MASSMVNDNHVASSQADTNSDNEDQESNSANLTGNEDEELEEIKARVREMEEEAEKLKQMQDDILASASQNDSVTLSPEEKAEADARSIFVGNVDYSATADDLEKHFHGCGSINRVTILCDKYTGHPKGFAYIEFGEKDSVETATALDDSLFKGRQIKVSAKRTNRPGLSTTNRPPRGRGSRGRGGFGRGYNAGGFGGGSPWGGGGFRGGRRPFRQM
ncbi:PREDICTED: polyadenylate-binding protein 2-like [Rhagoletis zephyria]|uniref:polyadenylate-binding protein 2-like n=1 Tax=Rhagoletis zephyria TaxID=28612 RepID=UPI00081150EE|nr:PREDICTED: polyadenylate-binding protein 2-like [Rhagoletis zephyria]